MSGGLRLLLLLMNTPEKGTYQRASQLGRHLAARGHRVTLVLTSRGRRAGISTYERDGVTMVESPDLFAGSLRSGWDPWNTINRLAWLAGRRWDLVHAFEARPTVLFPALYLQRLRGVPLVMDWADWQGRGGSVEERPSPLVRALLRPVESFFEERFRTWVDGTTAICTTLRAKALGLGVPAGSILLIPNGSETDRWRVVDPAEGRHRLGLPLDARLIGYVGTIFPRDAALMARAFDLVHASVPEARLLVAGHCPIEIGKLVEAPASVIQTGRVEEQQLNDYLAACDLCWLPLRDSGANRGRWPGKLNDYLAAGRPVVATAVGDVATLLQEEAVGLLAPDEPEPFAGQTIRLLEDDEMRAAMGWRAREVAERRFDWGRLTDELEALYRQVLTRREPAEV